MNLRFIAACSCAVACSSLAKAGTSVGLDYVLAFDGDALVFADGFDAPTLQVPPWFVLSGSPLSSVGSALQMAGGDSMLTPLSFSGAANDTFIAQTNLTDFSGDSAIVVQLVGAQFDDSVGILLTPTFAAAISDAGVLGSIAYSAGATSQFVISTTPSGDVLIKLDGQVVYAGASGFGAPAYAIVSVVPEPATLATLAIAAGLLIRRRR